jgi:hypothetical protein
VQGESTQVGSSPVAAVEHITTASDIRCFLGEDYRDAYLGGADLTGADLGGADLAGARQLTQAQLDAAHGDPTTRLPAGLQQPAGSARDEDSRATGS